MTGVLLVPPVVMLVLMLMDVPFVLIPTKESPPPTKPWVVTSHRLKSLIPIALSLPPVSPLVTLLLLRAHLVRTVSI